MLEDVSTEDTVCTAIANGQWLHIKPRIYLLIMLAAYQICIHCSENLRSKE